MEVEFLFWLCIVLRRHSGLDEQSDALGVDITLTILDGSMNEHFPALVPFDMSSNENPGGREQWLDIVDIEIGCEARTHE